MGYKNFYFFSQNNMYDIYLSMQVWRAEKKFNIKNNNKFKLKFIGNT